MISFQGKPFTITVIQVYAPITNAREAEVEWFYDDLQDIEDPAVVYVRECFAYVFL